MSSASFGEELGYEMQHGAFPMEEEVPLAPFTMEGQVRLDDRKRREQAREEWHRAIYLQRGGMFLHVFVDWGKTPRHEIELALTAYRGSHRDSVYLRIKAPMPFRSSHIKRPARREYSNFLKGEGWIQPFMTPDQAFPLYLPSRPLPLSAHERLDLWEGAFRHWQGEELRIFLEKCAR